MIVKLLTEHHLEFLSLKGGCRGSHESTHVKMPHCWKSHALAHICYVSSIAAGINPLIDFASKCHKTIQAPLIRLNYSGLVKRLNNSDKDKRLAKYTYSVSKFAEHQTFKAQIDFFISS